MRFFQPPTPQLFLSFQRATLKRRFADEQPPMMMFSLYDIPVCCYRVLTVPQVYRSAATPYASRRDTAEPLHEADATRRRAPAEAALIRRRRRAARR